MIANFAAILLASLAPQEAATAEAATAEALPQSETEIRQLIARFDAAIRAKDLSALERLFYKGKISWLATGHPESRAMVARIEGKTPEAVEDTGAHKLLADPRLASIAVREEFGDPIIRTDGQLATVTFGYAFLANGQVQNWGEESWQMVRTDDGWKIVNLMFSYNLQPVRPRPKP